MRRVVSRVAMIALVGVGCSESAPSEPEPITGQTHRFALDLLELRTMRDTAPDIDGNGRPDNGLANVLNILGGYSNLTPNAFDMIVGGAVPTALELVADDLTNDPVVRARLLATPDATFVPIQGRLIDGWFRSDRSPVDARTTDLLLPVFLEADPSRVSAVALQVTLSPDEFGGYFATLSGAIPYNTELMTEIHRGISQMIASEPAEHRGFMQLLDSSPRDGHLTYEEVSNNPLVTSFLFPDVTLDGVQAVSFVLRAHFRACSVGQCLEGARFDHCFDRVLDGDETDVDCGGGCRNCEAAAVCMTAADCETNACEQGRCGPPSCTNGVRDGLESDVDCGASCAGCALGKRCYLSVDCASHTCGPEDRSDYDFSASTCYPFVP